MFCAKCGSEIPEGSGFCPKCGTPAGGRAAGAAPAQKAAPEQAAGPQPAAPNVQQGAPYGQQPGVPNGQAPYGQQPGAPYGQAPYGQPGAPYGQQPYGPYNGGAYGSPAARSWMYSDKRYGAFAPGGWFSFKGRVSRREYWGRGILMWILLFVALGIAASVTDDTRNGTMALGLFAFAALFALGLSTISLAVRRLHDLNLSGLWVIALIAAIGLGFVPVREGSAMMAILVVICLLALVAIVVLCFICGTKGPNRFGPDSRI